MNNNLDFTDVDYVSPAAISEGFDFLKEFGLYEFETHVECSKALGEAIRLTQVIPQYMRAGVSDTLERQFEHKASFFACDEAVFFGIIAELRGFEVVGTADVETPQGRRFVTTVRKNGNLNLPSLGSAVLHSVVEAIRLGGEYLGWAPSLTDVETASVSEYCEYCEDEPE